MVTKFRLEDVLGSTMSQRELARLSGVSFPTVNRLYNNKATRVDLETLDRLSAVLGCKPGDLLERKPERRRPKKRQPS